MACIDELWNDGRTDKSGSSGYKDTHILFLPDGIHLLSRHESDKTESVSA
jgi:hypothetical protein